MAEMKNLEEEQRKMRERMSRAKPKKQPAKSRQQMTTPEANDVQTLLARISDLERENAALRRQLATRPAQSEPHRAHEVSESERRHLFMKYSNVRRY